MTDDTSTTTSTDTGAQDDAGQATAPPAAPVPTPPATTPQQPAQQAATAPATGKDDQGKEWDLDGAVKEIGRLRGENAKDRTNAKAQAAKDAEDALVAKFLAAMGRTPEGDETPDPDKLAAELQASQQATADIARELAIYKAAGQHGADPAKLLDSRSFLATVKDTDPDDGDAIAAAIKTAVDNNASLKAARAASQSSADHAGGSGEGAVTPEQFAGMTGAERNALFRSDPATYNRLTGRE